MLKLPQTAIAEGTLVFSSRLDCLLKTTERVMRGYGGFAAKVLVADKEESLEPGWRLCRDLSGSMEVKY